jgi:hypothetical protein
MIERRHLAAATGFAFVAAWIGFNFGDALLCLLGAAVFWLAAGVLEGTVDLGRLQSRLSGEGEPPAPAAAPRRRTRPLR